MFHSIRWFLSLFNSIIHILTCFVECFVDIEISSTDQSCQELTRCSPYLLYRVYQDKALADPGGGGAPLLTAADLWFFNAPIASCSLLISRSWYILSIILIVIGPKHVLKMTVHFTRQHFQWFSLAPPLPRWQIPRPQVTYWIKCHPSNVPSPGVKITPENV